MWYALLIPFILTLISKRIWPRQLSLKELFFAPIVSFFCILISYLTLKSVNMSDVEYNGSLVIEARYYEAYDTWVTQTCSYTTTCCCDSKGNNCQTETHYYDCSYCDYNSAYYIVYTDNGKSHHVSEQYYNSLIRKWSATPKFVELNRSIDYSHGCGKDGNMYSIKWDGKPETSEAYVIEVSFKNPVKISHSAFKYDHMTKKEADTLGLYSYPEFYSYYKQKAILSNHFALSEQDNIKLEYLNGYLGPRNKVKIFTLLFYNKPIDIAFKQEQYWEGGNQNELVVCIGINDSAGIDWVKPFSWCDNKRILVDTREDIAELKRLNIDSVYNIYLKNVPLFFHYKSFKDFNYLTFEPTNGQIAFVYIMTLIVAILCIWGEIKNEMFES